METVRPTRVGRWRLRDVLARGPTGLVCLATDGQGRRAAFKIHERGEGETAGLVELSLLGWRHPGLAACLDGGRLPGDGRLYTVTEHVAGVPLGPAAFGGAAPDAARALVVAARLLASLATLHERGWLHRDLKDDNVLLESVSDRPVLLDFGLACTIEAARGLPPAGTPRAMAPELFAGAPASVASDLWAAGLLLAEAFLRRRLFGGGMPQALAAERRAFRALSPEDVAGLGDPALAALLQKLLQPDPASRPPDAAAALAALPAPDDAFAAGLAAEQLAARLSQALSRQDPRRAALLDAARRGRTWVEGFSVPDATIGQVMAGTQALAAAVMAPDERLRARLSPAGEAPPTVGDLAALLEALAAHGPLTLASGESRATDEAAREERRALVRRLSGLPGFEIFDEPPLAPAEALGVLRDWLGSQPALERRLVEQPPASREDLTEALDALARSGAVRLGAEGLVADEGRLPSGWPEAAAADEARAALAGLTEPDRGLVALLAACPRPVSAAELARATGRSCGLALEGLVGRGLLRRERDADVERFAIVAPRLRRALLALGPPPPDARSRLARALFAEAPDADAAADLCALLGEDAPAERDEPTLAALLLAAADELRRVGRLPPAIALLRRGVAGAGADGPHLRRLHLDLIDLLIRHNAHDGALAAVAAARGRLGDDPGLLVREARVLFLRGRLPQALELLERLSPAGMTREDAMLGLQTRAQARQQAGHPEAALADVREALRRGGDVADRRTMVLLDRAASIETSLGRFDDAARHYEQCLALAKKLGQELLIGTILNNLGRSIRQRGEKRRGLAVQEEAVARLERAGDQVNLANALNGLGAGWLTLGRVDTARRHLQRALSLARRLGDDALAGMVLNNMGAALAAEGRLPEAEEAFAESLALREQRGERRGQAAVLLARARVRLSRGHAEGAGADLAAAAERLAGARWPDLQTEAALLQARLALLRGELEPAAAAARRALELAEANRQGAERLAALDLLARTGRADLTDVEVEGLERGPWLADLLFTRAAAHEAAGRPADADADNDLALSILHEAPDGPVEARGLLLRVEADLARVSAGLSRDAPDYGKLGESLSRASRDLSRARALVEAHDLQPLRPVLHEASRRLAAVGEGGDMSGLAALSERLRNLERLAEINKALNTAHDAQELLDLIVDSAIEITGAARGFLILFDGRAEAFRAARNIDESTIHHPEFEISHSVARRVVKEGRPILTANAIDDPRLGASASISALKLLSILCVPLVSRDRTLGAIYLDHPQVVGRFDERHLETVTALAEQAAIALENARLSEGLAHSNQELRASREEIARLNEALEKRLVEREAELETVRESLDASRRALALRYDYGNIVTRSPRMHEVLDLMDRITDTEFPVLILGDSGTGKELIARAIHYNGRRKELNFVSLNCAAFAEPLIESELFGHVRGAFTGADRDRKGLFEQAHGGTLFLDEIGDMSLEVQKRLLRVLQEGEFIPVGGREVRKVDVRILCATHRDLRQWVAEKRFREDLYYRLAVVQIRLPPLRERGEDIALLLPHFLQRHGGAARAVDPEALALLRAQGWPGNVRELENFAMNLLLFDREGTRVTAEQVRRLLAAGTGEVPAAPDPGDASGSLKERLDAYERRLIEEALQRAGGSKSAAARDLGVGIRTLYKMLARLGIAD